MGIFTGKTAIITGGGKAKSIGYGIATAYAKEGANLVLTLLMISSHWFLILSFYSTKLIFLCKEAVLLIFVNLC